MSIHLLRKSSVVLAATMLAMPLAVSPLAISPAYAWRIVYDPTNYAQNVLTALRTCRSPRSRRFSRTFRRPSSS